MIFAQNSAPLHGRVTGTIQLTENVGQCKIQTEFPNPEEK